MADYAINIDAPENLRALDDTEWAGGLYSDRIWYSNVDENKAIAAIQDYAKQYKAPNPYDDFINTFKATTIWVTYIFKLGAPSPYQSMHFSIYIAIDNGVITNSYASTGALASRRSMIQHHQKYKSLNDELYEQLYNKKYDHSTAAIIREHSPKLRALINASLPA
jgi:hypothetical protein